MFWKKFFSKAPNLSLFKAIELNDFEAIKLVLDQSDLIDQDNNNVFQYIAKYSQNSVFFKKAFELLIQHNENVSLINHNHYTYIETLIINNPYFHIDKGFYTLVDFLIQNHFPKELSKTALPIYYLVIQNIPGKYITPEFSTNLKRNSISILPFLTKENRGLLIFPDRGNFLLLQNILSSETEAEFISKTIGGSGKQIIKSLYNHIFTKRIINIYALFYIKNLVDNYDIKIKSMDIIFNSPQLKIAIQIGLQFFTENKNELVINIKDTFNQKEVIKFFIDSIPENLLIIEDTVGMHKKFSSNIGQIKTRQFKKLSELHDFLYLTLSRFKHENFFLENNHLFKIHKTKFFYEKNLYEFNLPITNQELVNLGDTLGICIGNGDYALKHQEKKSILIKLLKNNEIFGAIEYSYSNKIIQAVSMSNKVLPDALQRLIRKVISEILFKKEDSTMAIIK